VVRQQQVLEQGLPVVWVQRGAAWQAVRQLAGQRQQLLAPQIPKRGRKGEREALLAKT
jgi:hypothetical protein